MTGTIATGIVLFIFSLPPLALMAREYYVSRQVDHRYDLIDVPVGVPGTLELTHGRHVIRVSDDAGASSNHLSRANGLVKIEIDGRDYSSDTIVPIRPFWNDENRYWGFVHIQKVRDSQENRDYVVISERLGAAEYRLLWVPDDGDTVVDSFQYRDRCAPAVRAMLIRGVTPHPSGYCSDVLQTWPTVFVPLLYPWVSGGLGVVLMATGLFRLRLRANNRS